MQCKNHPDKQAIHFCVACEIPLCDDCAEESEPGQYYCFKCAMMTSVSAVSATIRDKKERAADGKAKKKKKLAGFHYFVILTSTLILAMWGFILFGGKEYPGLESNVNLAGNTRVLLFMVDGGIKSYAHDHKDSYPQRLLDLVPDYLSIASGQLRHLELLSYEKDPKKGYRLFLANPDPGEMKIVISADGIQYQLQTEKEA
jgi:hypothetical protein